MVYQMVFSPTGGTKKVSEILAEGLADGAEQGTWIDLTDRTADFSACAFQREDAVVIAVPSYGGRVPVVAAERIRQVKGNGAQCVLLCVYGNRAYEDTLVELSDTAEEAGFRPVAAVAAVAEHSILRQYAAGRPDKGDEEQLKDFAEKIGARLKEEGEKALPAIPGNRPYKKASGAGMVPKAGEDCTACGSCRRSCPVGAIPQEDPRTADAAKCISCMRCLSVCPRSARKVSKVMLSAAGMALKKACSQRKECELFL